MKIAIVSQSHVPFIIGGAEKLWWGMQEYINKHTAHQCDLIRLPTKESNFWELLDSYYMFYNLDLASFDMIISGKYPGWMVQHHNHHIYMLHTLRSVYDCYNFSKWGNDVETKDIKIQYILDKLEDTSTSIEELFKLLFELKVAYNASCKEPFNYEGALMRKVIQFFDKKSMENIHSFSAISHTVANRKEYFPPQMHVEVIHPPSNLEGYANHSSDYFFTVSRLDYPKRIDMMVEAYLKSDTTLPLKIAGTGPLTEKLKTLSKDDPRIELLGFVSDDDLIEYYTKAYAVIFIPREEDYGLVTIEAMKCEKPILTFSDSGGVLEFVEDHVTGLVCEPNIEALTENINYIAHNQELCISMGKAAKSRVEKITWKNTIDKLLQNASEQKKISENNSIKRKRMTTASKTRISTQRSTNVPVDMDDFTQYHDAEFINNLYRGILGREPDKQEFKQNLDLLRSGKISKIDILTTLRFSQEGKAKNIRIRAGRKRYIISKLFRTPVLGYLLTLFTPQRTTQKLNQLEAELSMQLKKLKVDNQNNKIDKEKIETVVRSLAYMKEQVKQSHNSIHELVSEAKKRLPDQMFNQNDLQKLSDEEKHHFDAFYVAFEDKFRGTREDIKKRVEVYLPYIEALPFKKKKIKALDVGCGRGEWIELLSDRGYKAQGIDLNRIMVARSQELGLNAKEADVIEHLQSLGDDSLSVITGFHIIEHLPFEVLMKMYTEALRVLKPGGMVIFETPNPENLIVGASTFYTDPTHINPIPPYTAEFILKESGFTNVKVKRLHKYSDFYSVEKNDDFKNKYFYNEMDYSIIGYKI